VRIAPKDYIGTFANRAYLYKPRLLVLEVLGFPAELGICSLRRIVRRLHLSAKNGHLTPSITSFSGEAALASGSMFRTTCRRSTVRQWSKM
jgi:hypothetical protein